MRARGGRGRRAGRGELLGVAQSALVLAQPGEAGAAGGGFQSEALAQDAGEDGFRAALAGAHA
jgi:hypothetical protein